MSGKCPKLMGNGVEMEMKMEKSPEMVFLLFVGALAMTYIIPMVNPNNF